MKIAVVGGGIFGCTAAIALAKNGFDVDLFEREDAILRAASGVNQFRLHRGFHYPRSVETALSSRRAELSFKKEYGEAVIDSFDHYYLISASGSKVSAKEFKEFCRTCDLSIVPVEFPLAAPGTIEQTFKVQESIIDRDALAAVISRRLKQYNVKVHLNTVFSLPSPDHDVVVNCTYANLNSVSERGQETMKKYQFEVCEKPIMKLPPEFARLSAVVMDGPFFCIDPYGKTDLHLMGNVVHAIHATNVGHFPEIPNQIAPFLNKGMIKNPPITRFKDFIQTASKYIPALAGAKHVGSLYTVRTVLPHVDATDERPTIVSRAGESLINVFSGKLGNCVEAAQEVVATVISISEQRSMSPQLGAKVRH